MPLLVGAAGVFGLLIGSFLNVVVWRVPRGESLLPDSHCPRCDAPIRPWQNFPVISWLALRGRCANCGERISVRYPLVELGTGLAFAMVAFWFVNWSPLAGANLFEGGPEAVARWLALAGYLWFAAAGIALMLIDLDHKRLPDAVVLPSLLAVVTLLATSCLVVGDWQRLVATLGGGAVLFLFYFVVAIVYPRGIGGGDVKLAPLVGTAVGFVSWSSLFVGAFAGFFLGAIAGLLLVALRRATRKSGIPFGPFMLVGAWLGILWGQALFEAYLDLFGLR